MFATILNNSLYSHTSRNEVFLNQAMFHVYNELEKVNKVTNVPKWGILS